MKKAQRVKATLDKFRNRTSTGSAMGCLRDWWEPNRNKFCATIREALVGDGVVRWFIGTIEEFMYNETHDDGSKIDRSKGELFNFQATINQCRAFDHACKNLTDKIKRESSDRTIFTKELLKRWFISAYQEIEPVIITAPPPVAVSPPLVLASDNDSKTRHRRLLQGYRKEHSGTVVFRKDGHVALIADLGRAGLTLISVDANTRGMYGTVTELLPVLCRYDSKGCPKKDSSDKWFVDPRYTGEYKSVVGMLTPIKEGIVTGIDKGVITDFDFICTEVKNGKYLPAKKLSEHKEEWNKANTPSSDTVSISRKEYEDLVRRANIDSLAQLESKRKELEEDMEARRSCIRKLSDDKAALESITSIPTSAMTSVVSHHLSKAIEEATKLDNEIKELDKKIDSLRG